MPYTQTQIQQASTRYRYYANHRNEYMHQLSHHIPYK